MQPQGSVAWHRFATLADASEALAEAVAIRLRALLAGQGRASLAVPGGTTPARFLAALGTREVSSNIATVTQAAGETGASATQVLGAARELGEQADIMKSQVETFLSGIRAA